MKLTLTRQLYYPLSLLLVAFLLTGCNEWQGKKDFRNYLREKHPYSEIKETELGRWTFQVNDTLRGQIWIYKSRWSKSSIQAHCTNCN